MCMCVSVDVFVRMCGCMRIVMRTCMCMCMFVHMCHDSFIRDMHKRLSFGTFICDITYHIWGGYD